MVRTKGVPRRRPPLSDTVFWYLQRDADGWRLRVASDALGPDKALVVLLRRALRAAGRENGPPVLVLTATVVGLSEIASRFCRRHGIMIERQ